MRTARGSALLGLGVLLSIAASLSGPAVRDVATFIIGTCGSLLLLERSVHLPSRVRVPVLLMAAAGATFLIGSGIRVAFDAASGPNFPSLGEPVLLASYACIVASLTVLARRRRAGPDQDGLTDALVVACAGAVVIWSVWLAPYVMDDSVHWLDRSVNVAFAVMSTLIVVAVTRLATGPGARSVSLYLLMAGVVMFVASDLAATISSTGTSADWIAEVPNYLAPWIYLLLGAAVVHPSVARLAEPPDECNLRLTKGRTRLLMVGLLVPPTMVALGTTSSVRIVVGVAIAGWVAMGYLVLVRFTRLVDGHRRAADVQAVLRQANAELASATSRHGMQRAGLTATRRLLEETDVRVILGEIVQDELRVVDAVGTDAHTALGTSTKLSAIPEGVLDRLHQRRPTTADAVAPIDLGPASDGVGDRVCILATPLTTRNELTGVMIVTTPDPIPATARQSIETLASTLSLALESAALTERLLRRRSERRFRALVENSSDIVLVIDAEGVISFSSPAAHRLLGLSEQTLLGTHPARWLHSDDWPALARMLEPGAESRASSEQGPEVQIKHVDGGYRWFELQTKDLLGDPEIEGLVITAREVTDRKTAQQQLATSEARFRALVQNSTDVVAVVDEYAGFTYVSPAVTEMLGYRPEELEGERAVNLIEEADLEQLRAAYPELLPDDLPGDFTLGRFEVQVRHRSGDMRTLDVGITDMRHEPAIAGIVLNARDITVRKALEHDLRYQALHDSLTGLANRTQFTQRTAAALQMTTGDPVGALFVDIDDFKTLNDSLGHAVGDDVLREIADRLATNIVGATLVARLGGDEFALLVTNPSPNQVEHIAAQVNEVVAQPYLVDGREIRLTCSVGIATSTEVDDADARVLLRSADVAMYVAKERGKNGWAVFEERLHRSVFDRLDMKAALDRAVEQQEMECYYQPIVSLETGRISGVEALVRWNHPERGLLGPDSFIPLAEDTGLIIPLGRWVLRQACNQLRTWQLQLPSGASLTMSVNLSVRQLTHDAIVQEVREAIEDAQIDPSTLTLEITETTLMADTDLTRHRLAQLRELGVSLAVDDFGTGYSSLRYVQRFPIDVIKIDRSFVTGLGVRSNDGAVVQSMIELAQRLGVHTVAEGIETADQLAVLRSLGADLGQGYWFSRPVPPEGIELLLAEDQADPAGSFRAFLP